MSAARTRKRACKHSDPACEACLSHRASMRERQGRSRSGDVRQPEPVGELDDLGQPLVVGGAW